MKRTITALYNTRAEAQAAADALIRSNIGADIDIIDQSVADAHPDHQGFMAWLGGLFGGHEDHHAYAEGLRRGHFLLSAKVEELKETHAAEILEAANPLNLEDAQRTWRADGWREADAAPAEPPVAEDGPPMRIVGVAARSYRLTLLP